MDKLTPFQKALLNSVSEEYAAVPQEKELTEIAPIDHRKSKRHISSTLRRSLIAAAVILVLAGSVFAAVRFSIGSVRVDEAVYTFPAELNAGSNDIYKITFEADLAGENAPDYIKTYYLPTALVSTENLSKQNCFVESVDSYYYPYNPAIEENFPLEDNTITAFYEWQLGCSFDEHGNPEVDEEGNPRSGPQVQFCQRTAKQIPIGKPIVDFQSSTNSGITYRHETFVQGEYEIFCFVTDFSAIDDNEYPTCRTWYWTDGNYLYELRCGIGVSDEEMLEIFESVAPVEDINAYLGIEE